MPAESKNLKVVPVYMPRELYDELSSYAQAADRSMSYVARRLIQTALRDRKAIRKSIQNAPRDAT